MPDVNVFLYAHRSDDPVSEAYAAWLTELVDSGQPFALSTLVATAFVRIASHPRVFDPPTPLPLALATIDAFVARSTCHLLSPGPRHWSILTGLLRHPGVGPRRVADAQHAAVAIEHGCEWVTRDRDFAVFAGAGLRWRHLML